MCRVNLAPVLIGIYGPFAKTDDSIVPVKCMSGSEACRQHGAHSKHLQPTYDARVHRALQSWVKGLYFLP